MLLPKGASTRALPPANGTLSRLQHATSDLVARSVTRRFPALAPTASAPAHSPRPLPAMAAYSDAAAMAARIRAGDTLGLPPPQYPALAGCEPGSFAEATITTRLPAILSGMMADVRADLGDGEQVRGCHVMHSSALTASLLAGYIYRIGCMDCVWPPCTTPLNRHGVEAAARSC